MKRTVWGILLLGLIASSAHAIVITAPTGLNPGDQYRLAFVTSTATNSLSANIATYNAFVTSVANTVPELVALGTTWTAIASTATVAARDNTSTNPNVSAGFPIYILTGQQVAINNTALWTTGALFPGINTTEQGVQGIQPVVGVWTGTNADGTINTNGPLGLPFFSATSTGRSDLWGAPSWIACCSQLNTGNATLYAISAPLTVSAIPVPAAVWLFGSALGLMGVMRRKISS